MFAPFEADVDTLYRSQQPLFVSAGHWPTSQIAAWLSGTCISGSRVSVSISRSLVSWPVYGDMGPVSMSTASRTAASSGLWSQTVTIHTHTSIHTHTHTSTHTHTHTAHTHTHTHTAHACTHACTHTHKHTQAVKSAICVPARADSLRSDYSQKQLVNMCEKIRKKVENFANRARQTTILRD